jgi:hypothetical protein
MVRPEIDEIFFPLMVTMLAPSLSEAMPIYSEALPEDEGVEARLNVIVLDGSL